MIRFRRARKSSGSADGMEHWPVAPPAGQARACCRDLDLDLADAVGVALAAEYDTDAVLTLDRRDSQVVRPSGRHKVVRV